QGLEAWAGPVPARECIDEGGQGDHRGQHDHEIGKPIRDQDDAERSGPVPNQVSACGRLPSGSDANGLSDQHYRNDQVRDQSRERDGVFRDPSPLVEQQQQAAGHQGQQYGSDDQMVQPAARHGLSSPSTLSVPVKPCAAISTTSKSAVMAKEITMAVSTRAWGRGSE